MEKQRRRIFEILEQEDRQCLEWQVISDLWFHTTKNLSARFSVSCSTSRCGATNNFSAELRVCPQPHATCHMQQEEKRSRISKAGVHTEICIPWNYSLNLLIFRYIRQIKRPEITSSSKKTRTMEYQLGINCWRLTHQNSLVLKEKIEYI